MPVPNSSGTDAPRLRALLSAQWLLVREDADGRVQQSTGLQWAALLDALLTPFNNLALAQVLKSPLFSADDNDLMQLAALKSTPLRIDRLAALASELDASHPLHRAHQHLGDWSALADRIPVHDLLDRIYHESQLILTT